MILANGGSIKQAVEAATTLSITEGCTPLTNAIVAVAAVVRGGGDLKDAEAYAEKAAIQGDG